MRAALASIRVAFLGLSRCMPLLFGACAAAPPASPIGMSDAVPEHAPPARTETPRVHWPELASARAWPPAAPPFVASAHGREGSLLRVCVEPPFLEAYRALAAESPMPDGARVIAWRETAGGQPLGAYLLSKRAGAWSAAELDSTGALVGADHAACIRCHDMAPTDHLFGVRRSTPPEHVAGESLDPQPR